MEVEIVFRKLRRKDRIMAEIDSIEVLDNGNYGVLSITNMNGYPYGIPLNYVFMNKNIYFHSATEGDKIDSIANNNKASFCVVGESTPLPDKFSMKYKSVIVFGTVIEVDGREKDDALLGLITKYSPQFIDNGKKYIESDKHKTKVLKLNIEYICGKARV